MIKQISRYIAFSAIFLIPFFPLIVVDSFFFPFITGKAFYFRVLVEIGFLAYVALASIDSRYRPKFSALTASVSAFTIIVLIADLLGVNPLRSIWSNFERMEGWVTILHLWMFYIVISGLFGYKDADSHEETMKWWRAWMNVFIGAGCIVGIYALTQFFGGAEIHQGSSRIDASLGNAAYLAVYMLMNIGMAVYLLFETKRRKGSVGMQWMYGVLAFVFSFLLFETATRGTILGLVGGIMLSLFLYAVLAKGASTRSRVVSGLIILGIVLIGGIFWANRDSDFVQNHEALRRMATISINDVKTQARGYIWPMALTGFSQRPVLGWGQENFNYIFNANYNPEMWSQEQWFDRAHNVYLDWLVASGIVGLFAYLVLYFLALLYIWKSKLTIAEKSALTGLIVAYAVHNVFVFDNLASYVAFFALLAFLNSALHVKESNKTKKTFSSDIIEYVITPLLIVALIILIYFVNIRPIQSNLRLISAMRACGASSISDTNLFNRVYESKAYMSYQEAREQALMCASSVIGNSQVSGAVKQQMFIVAADAIDSQIASAPKDARMYVLGGQFLNSLSQFAPAQKLLEQAHALTPGKQGVNFELANNLLNNGQIEKGVILLKEAYEADPSYPQAQSAYAMGLLLTGKESTAKTLFKDKPDIFTTEQAAQIYASPMVKKYDQAIAIYSSLIEKSPDDINLQVRLAQVMNAAGRRDEAVLRLRAIYKTRPEYKEQVEAFILQALK